MRYYREGAHKEAQTRLVAPLSRDVSNRRVLVVDDVNDTGDTLVEVRRALAEANASEVRTAVFDEKQTSAERADFCARTIEGWHWIIYQWALLEDVSGFLDRMDPAPGGEIEARAALKHDYGLDLPAADWQRIATLRHG